MGSVRITASSTISSATTITRSAAKATSVLHPHQPPQMAVARGVGPLHVDNRHDRVDGRYDRDRPGALGVVDKTDTGIDGGQIAPGVAAQRIEGQIGCNRSPPLPTREELSDN